MDSDEEEKKEPVISRPKKLRNCLTPANRSNSVGMGQ
jgi:hypothetical protein